MAKKPVLRSPASGSAKAGQTSTRISNVRILVCADKEQPVPAAENQNTVDSNVLAGDPGTVLHAARVDALEKSIAERELEIRELYRTVDQLQQRLTERDDQIEETLYELRAAATVASLSGAAASKQLAYIHLLRRIRATVQQVLPRDGIVAVVSKGCEEMARLYGRVVWHFPQDTKGGYLGYYPSNSQSAIAQLVAAQSRGATYFLLPATAFWWLDKYPEFARHLEIHCRVLMHEPESCAIFALRERGTLAALHDFVAGCGCELGGEPAILDWDTGQNLKGRFLECNVFSPLKQDAPLPYLSGTFDVVALDRIQTVRMEEARRVAASAIIATSDETAPLVERASTSNELPAVSIIISSADAGELNDSWLRGISDYVPLGIQTEIIVMSPSLPADNSATLENRQEGEPKVKLYRTELDLNFLARVNRAAELATGAILIVLDSDTIVLPGWLPALLRTFRVFPDAGAVGGKLILSDGTLAEAGAVIFKDASTAPFGRRDHRLDAPLYNYVRPVDYCSPTIFATPRVLFQKVGGFDAKYESVSYGTADYGFKIRAAGHQVYYQPECASVGFDRANDEALGTDVEESVDRARFAAAWSTTLKGQFQRPERFEFATLHALIRPYRTFGGDAE